MLNQPENENQQVETVTPEEVQQILLATIDSIQQEITDLSDEQLEEIAGGLNIRSGLVGAFNNSRWNYTMQRNDGMGRRNAITDSFGAMKDGWKIGSGKVQFPPQSPSQAIVPR